MCDPISIATVGLSIGQGVLGYSSASAQANQQTTMARQNAANAATATETQYDQINRRMMQDDMASNQKRQQIALEASKDAATVQVAASENGVSGLAVDHVLQDLYAQEGRSTSALDTNQQFDRAYLQQEKVSAQAGGQNQINSVPTGETPSFAPYLINIFGSGLDAYTGYKKRQQIAGAD